MISCSLNVIRWLCCSIFKYTTSLDNIVGEGLTKLLSIFTRINIEFYWWLRACAIKGPSRTPLSSQWPFEHKKFTVKKFSFKFILINSLHSILRNMMDDTVDDKGLFCSTPDKETNSLNSKWPVMTWPLTTKCKASFNLVLIHAELKHRKEKTRTYSVECLCVVHNLTLTNCKKRCKHLCCVCVCFQ